MGLSTLRVVLDVLSTTTAGGLVAQGVLVMN